MGEFIIDVATTASIGGLNTLMRFFVLNGHLPTPLNQYVILRIVPNPLCASLVETKDKHACYN